MPNSPSTTEDDWIAILVVVVMTFASGIVSVGMFLDPMRIWMLQHHLLEQGESTVIPIVDGIGLGWGQILVIAAIILSVIALLVWLQRRAAARV